MAEKKAKKASSREHDPALPDEPSAAAPAQPETAAAAAADTPGPLGSWELWHDEQGRVWIEKEAFELLTSAKIVEIHENVTIPDEPAETIEPHADADGRTYYVLGEFPVEGHENVFGLGAESPPCRRHR